MSERDNRVHGVGLEDELEIYVAEAQQDPAFRAAYEDVQERHSIVDRLLALRRHHKLSQRTVAARMGVRQPTVSGFETEDSDPRLSTLQRYARAVGARLRLVIVVPNECDWISVSGNVYRGNSPQGNAGVAIRQGDLAKEWFEEKQQFRKERWAIPA
jgi:transcriptional regulator with XRE-family HTH domain